MPLPDEQLLLITGLAYLAVVAVAVWWLSERADGLLRIVRENVDPQLWQDLGAPASVKAALKDPQRRWLKFMRGGDYRLRCKREVVAAIDAYRHRSNWLLMALALLGILIAYRFWPLLKPAWL